MTAFASLLQWLNQLRRGQLIALLTLLFVGWHVVLVLAGVRFDTSFLPLTWQLLDPEWLRTDLLSSLIHLHSQPPLFNLIVGLVLKLAPGHEVIALQALFTLSAWVLYLAMFGLLRVLNVSRAMTLAVSTFYVTSPGVILYEHWLFYTLPTAVILLLSTALLARALRVPDALSLSAALLSVAALCLLRSVFHPLYPALVVVGLWWVVPKPRRSLVLRCAVVPLLCVFALAAKNRVLFGTFSSSSWLGMNVARVVTENVPRNERVAWVQEGTISPLALIPPFSSVEAYPPCEGEARFSDVPEFARPRKPSGAINFNHVRYLCTSRTYLDDARTIVRLRPASALRNIARAWLTYFRPVTEYGLLAANKPALGWWLTVHEALSFQLPLPETLLGFTEIPLPSVVLLLTVFTVAGWMVWRRPAWASLDRQQAWIVMFMLLTVVGFALLVNTLELGENNRFRAEVGSLHVVLAGLVLDRLIKRRRAAGGAACLSAAREPHSC